MPYPLLATKLYLPPARPTIVKRPRLTARLSEGLRRPLTLVSAPAGFGKSTLLSEWRATPEGQGYPVAWLSLDSGDNDPGRFWAYAVGALRTLPGLAGLAEELDAGAPPELLLTPVINGLAAAADAAVLVLDDYHVIESPAIHTAVSFLVEHLPAGLRLVILTRSDPPWPLGRLRANGLMSELRADDLRFTPAEAGQFLRGLALPPGDLAILERRTEGWIAALQMAAISLDGHPDPHGFITAFSGDNRYIADYLAEEVVAKQPEPLRRFLLQTAVLDRFNAALCEAVTGSPESRSRLEQIERKNLFLVPLDPTRSWFRFHHLFGELLRTRLQHEEPETVPILHGRASAWFAGQGLLLEAVEHSLSAGEFGSAGKLIEQNLQAMTQPMFREWLLRLPPEVGRQHAWACTFQAWNFCLTGQLDEAARLIDAAERHTVLPDDLRAGLALMRTYMADLTGRPYVLTDQLVQSPAYIPEANVAMRSSVDMVVASLLHSHGRLDEAATLLARAAERGMARGIAGAVPTAVARLARIRLIEGRTAEAADLCRQYNSALEQQGAERLFSKGNLHAVLADALRLQGRLAEAEAEALAGVRCNEAMPIPHGIALALHSLARVRFARGDAAGALDLLGRAEAAVRGRTLPPDLVSDAAALRVQIWLRLGDTDAAERWARESGLTAGDPLSFRREVEQIALARVLLATGRRGEGTALAARLAEAAAAAGRLGRLEEIRSLSAPVGEPLTEREREVLALLARGCSNQEMAAQLFVSVSTAKAHVHNILFKLDVPSRTRALARAKELGLIK